MKRPRRQVQRLFRIAILWTSIVPVVVGTARGQTYYVHKVQPLYAGNPVAPQAIGGIGDVNADGVSDFAVANPDWSDSPNTAPGKGRIWIYSGASREELNAITGTSKYNRLGSWLSSIGDLDGDGSADLLAGATGVAACHDGPTYYLPFVRAFSGRTLQTTFTINGAADTYFGYQIVRLGNIDGVNGEEFLAGRLWRYEPCNSSYSSGAELYSTRPGQGNASATLLNSFGGFNNSKISSLGSIGDVTGDGIPDFALGRPRTIAGTPWSIEVYSGATRALISILDTEDGREIREIAALGDINGDGLSDFAVGQADIVAPMLPGVVRVYYGSVTAGGSLVRVISSKLQAFGNAIIPLEDINGDAVPDVAVGSFRDVQIYSGASLNAGTTVMLRSCPAPEGALASVDTSTADSLGDLDFDGIEDLP